MKNWMWLALGGGAVFLWWYSKNSKSLMPPPKSPPVQMPTGVVAPEASEHDYVATTGQEYFRPIGLDLPGLFQG